QRLSERSNSFVDIAGATGPQFTLANALLADDGARFRVRVANAYGSDVSEAATLSVTSNQPPTAVILNPESGLSYVGGQTFSFSGMGVDAEDGSLAPSQLTWRVDFHHNVHSHPFFPSTSGIASGEFTIPNTGETSANVWYRVHLTAVDSIGLTSTTFVDIQPQLSGFRVTTNLGAGDIVLDGALHPAPYDVTAVVGIERTLEAPPSQIVDGTAYLFTGWDDGTPTRIRTIDTPAVETAYTALYGPTALTFLSELDPVGTPVNGLGPFEKDRANGTATAGDGNPLTIAGVEYVRGLGVYANSDLTYDLGGEYVRFQADIGLDDSVPGGTAVFQAFADETLVYSSGVVSGGQGAVSIDLDLRDVQELRLVVSGGPDGTNGDAADWADARLLKSAPGGDVRVNFQTADSVTPDGYLPDGGEPYALHLNGYRYGWSEDHSDDARDRNINPDQRWDTLVHFHQGEQWEIELPNGAYVVTVAIGDAGFESTHTVNVEGTSYYLNEPTAANEFRKRSQIVLVADGRLTIDQGVAADRATRIDFIEIAPVDAELPPPWLPGDVNLDGRLDMADIDDFIAGWRTNTSQMGDEQRIRTGDLNLNGVVNFDDWWIIHEAFKEQDAAFDANLAELLAVHAAAQTEAPEPTLRRRPSRRSSFDRLS
ncbi:MAG: NPCBM/NEW2 domain-containing protein, partial [Planctomycetales bacterium]|nr:NPCBM/NEW2 domain-containing protein [Planctomycetales bacterium]